MTIRWYVPRDGDKILQVLTDDGKIWTEPPYYFEGETDPPVIDPPVEPPEPVPTPDPDVGVPDGFRQGFRIKAHAPRSQSPQVFPRPVKFGVHIPLHENATFLDYKVVRKGDMDAELPVSVWLERPFDTPYNTLMIAGVLDIGADLLDMEIIKRYQLPEHALNAFVTPVQNGYVIGGKYRILGGVLHDEKGTVLSVPEVDGQELLHTQTDILVDTPYFAELEQYFTSSNELTVVRRLRFWRDSWIVRAELIRKNVGNTFRGFPAYHTSFIQPLRKESSTMTLDMNEGTGVITGVGYVRQGFPKDPGDRNPFYTTNFGAFIPTEPLVVDEEGNKRYDPASFGLHVNGQQADDDYLSGHGHSGSLGFAVFDAWVKQSLGFAVTDTRFEIRLLDTPSPIGKTMHWGQHATDVIAFCYDIEVSSGELHDFLQHPVVPILDADTLNELGVAFNYRTRVSMEEIREAFEQLTGREWNVRSNPYNASVTYYASLHHRRAYKLIRDDMERMRLWEHGFSIVEGMAYADVVCDTVFCRQDSVPLTDIEGVPRLTRFMTNENPSDISHLETGWLENLGLMTGEIRYIEAAWDYVEEVLHTNQKGPQETAGWKLNAIGGRPFLRNLHNAARMYYLTGDERLKALMFRILERFSDPEQRDGWPRHWNKARGVFISSHNANDQYVHPFFDLEINYEVALTIRNIAGLKAQEWTEEEWAIYSRWSDVITAQALFFLREANQYREGEGPIANRYTLGEYTPYPIDSTASNSAGAAVWLARFKNDPSLLAKAGPNAAKVLYVTSNRFEYTRHMFQEWVWHYHNVDKWQKPYKRMREAGVAKVEEGEGVYIRGLPASFVKNGGLIDLRISDKPIVEWLKYSQVTGEWEYEPNSYEHFCAAECAVQHWYKGEDDPDVKHDSDVSMVLIPFYMIKVPEGLDKVLSHYSAICMEVNIDGEV